MAEGGSTARRLTKRTVEALKPGELVWDSEVKGFGIRCQRAAKVYVLKTRVKGRQRWFTIGRHGSPWTVEDARRRAGKLLAFIDDGKDPAAAREASRHAPTMADLCDRYLREYAAEHKKPSSALTDRRNIENHILPLLGRYNVADVSRADVDWLKLSVREGKTATGAKPDQRGGSVVRGGTGVANRCLALLSKMFNLAERWGWREDGANPVRHIGKYRENRRERFLSSEELSRLAESLRQAEKRATISPFAAAAIRLLTFTGARLGEILALRWDQVDFERAMLMLPDSKTGQKVIYLSAPALETLANLPRLDGNPHVICGEKAGAHLVNLRKPWHRIRGAAGISELRLHDLRHSFAAVAASGGLSLPIIGKLLGHTQPATTARYAHLAADPLRAANEAVAAKIAAAMRPQVVPSTGEEVNVQFMHGRTA